jgi:predicted nuclease of restriction endonuclease-like (RecB) superfamily
VQAPLAQLPWYHHLALLQKLDSAEKRLRYAQAALENGWSRDILALRIDTGFHRRAGKAVTNFAAAIPDEESDLAQQADGLAAGPEGL